MKTLKIGWSFTNLVVILLLGALISNDVFAQAGRPGGSGGRSGGHGGPGMGGGGHGGGRHPPVTGHYHGGGWRGGSRVGFYWGIPMGGYGYGYYPYYGSRFYGSGYYGMPYYYPSYPAPVVQSAPVIYIERGDNQQVITQEVQKNSPEENQGPWWYYCVDAKGYYPYVNQCPGGWLRVEPQPAPGSGDQPASDNSGKPSAP